MDHHVFFSEGGTGHIDAHDHPLRVIHAAVDAWRRGRVITARRDDARKWILCKLAHSCQWLRLLCVLDVFVLADSTFNF